MIQLNQVSKTFNAGQPNCCTALKRVDLSINGEGVIVFQGPSGSGKTTLLSLLGGMSRPTTGRIWVDGTEITSLSERFLAGLRQEHFGFVFQDFQLIHGISALTNVLLPLYPVAGSLVGVRRRAMALLEELEIAPKAKQSVESLSGGEQQRVALARALINDPHFLVADEPTAHLDTELSRRFLNIVDRLRKRGKTVLLASHDPLVTESFVAKRVVRLRGGRIQEKEE